MNINDMIKSAMESIEYQTKRINMLLSEKNLNLLVLDCVSDVSVTEGCVSFYLNQDSDREMQRKLINQIARVYKVKLAKHKSYWKECLNVEGTTAEGIKINIYNYVPPSCQIVEVEEPAAEWELENARKQIAKAQALIESGKKSVKQVVCQ